MYLFFFFFFFTTFLLFLPPTPSPSHHPTSPTHHGFSLILSSGQILFLGIKNVRDSRLIVHHQVSLAACSSSSICCLAFFPISHLLPCTWVPISGSLPGWLPLNSLLLSYAHYQCPCLHRVLPCLFYQLLR